MARVLVTGVAGFIGSHLAQALIRHGHEVRGVDNLSAGHLENLAEFRGQLEFRRQDVRDAAAMEEACRGVDCVFHEAAIASVAMSVEHPVECDAVNLGGALNVLEGARRQGVRRVVLAASAAVYGDDPDLPKREDMLPRPITPYGVQKLACEHYLHSYWRVFGVETVALRYFNVFGPRQDPSSPYSGVLSIFFDKTFRDEPVVIFGDGETSRDFTYIDNVVGANLLAMHAPTAAVAGKVFNIVIGRAVSLNQALTAIQNSIGNHPRPRYAAERIGDIRHSVADISLAQRELGYSPRIGFEEGVRRAAAWFEQKREKNQTSA